MANHTPTLGNAPLLDVDDLVFLLKLETRRAVYNRVHRGTVPAPIRVGASLRWRPEDVSAWLDAQQDGGATR